MAYCPDCWTEFVSGVALCSDCGGALTLGPRPEQRPRATAATESANPEQSAIDTLLGEFPGSRAEFIAQALTMEGIHSRLECDGLVQHRGPNTNPAGPIAVTLPVTILVAAAEADRAREILESLSAEDLVGEEWAEVTATADADPFDPHTTSLLPPEDPASPAEIEAEGSKTPVMLLIIAAFLLLLYLIRR